VEVIMSTKNLARTVIEGGRTNHDKYNRRISLREFRINNHRYCHAVHVGAIDYDAEFEPERVWDYRFRDEIHADKTRPCDRFLASRAGRPWNDVVSEIVRRFDTNTLPGRHIVYEHLVNRVALPDSWRYLAHWWGGYAPKFWVDEEGILHHNKKERF
jgi:hypothetical protein